MSDRNGKTRYVADNDGAMKVNAKGRIRFNVIDFFAVLIVILILAALAVYFLPGITGRFSSGGEAEITYVLEFRGIDDIFIANVQVGDNVYDLRGWNSDLIGEFTIPSIPYSMLLTPYQRVTEYDVNLDKAAEQIEQLVKKHKEKEKEKELKKKKK